MPSPQLILTGSLLATLSLAGCGGGKGSYNPPPGPVPDPAPTASRAALDLVSGRLTEGGGEILGSGSVIGFVRIRTSASVAVSAVDAVDAVGVRSGTAAVTVPTGYVATTELTRGQWKTLVQRSGAAVDREPWMLLSPEFRGATDDALPAVNLRWDDIDAVVRAWNARYRYQIAVPTGFLWENAARPIKNGLWVWGEDASLAATYAVVLETSSATPGPRVAGSKAAAINGLRDTAGNVWEWVADGGTDGGPTLRGGSWADPLLSAQAGNRLDCPTLIHHPTAGVRLILELP